MDTSSLARTETLRLGRSSGFSLCVEGDVDPHVLQEYFSGDAAVGSPVPEAQVSVCVRAGTPEGVRARFETYGDGSLVEHFPGRFMMRAQGDDTLAAVGSDYSYGVFSSFASNDQTFPSTIELAVCSRISDSPESLLLRIYRDLLHHSLRQKGYVLLHAAVGARDGVGTAFLGDKGAGKTAWLSMALARGWHLVANDRVFFHPSSRHCVAFPIAVMVSRSTLKNLPTSLVTRLERGECRRKDHLLPGYTKVGFTPREFASAFDSRLADDCQIDQVCFLAQAAGPVRLNILEALPRAETTARWCVSNIYTPKDPTYAFNLFCRPTRGKGLEPEAVLGGVPLAYEARYSWEAFDNEYRGGGACLRQLR